jgi:predicted nucleic acid-binding protein
MQLLLHDANIIIDLLEIQLWEVLFRLPYKMGTTDFVISEIYKGDQKQYVETHIKELKIISSTALEVQNIQTFKNNHRGLSFADCSIVFHAQEKGAIIISGDKALRKTAEQYKVPVRGILWILEEFVRKNLINRETAIIKLKLLYEINPRLPRTEIETLLRKWEKEDL